MSSCRKNPCSVGAGLLVRLAPRFVTFCCLRTTNAHESTRIKKRGSTENTEDTEKNTVLPSVFFRAFRGQIIRGQEKRDLCVRELVRWQSVACPSVYTAISSELLCGPDAGETPAVPGEAACREPGTLGAPASCRPCRPRRIKKARRIPEATALCRE